MNDSYLIGIIDDSWPHCFDLSDETLIDYDAIKGFVSTDVDWAEQGLKHFIKSLVSRASKISDVEIVGFYLIQNYLEAIDKNKIPVPNILIIDWDYGTNHKASDFLPQVLAKNEGLENLYIFSRSENMEDITECLIRPEILNPGVSIYLYDKGKKEHEHGATLAKLIDRALRKKEDVNGRSFKYENYDIKFETSEYLDHYLDFWKVVAIAGAELTFDTLKEHNLTLNKIFLEALFNKIPVPLFIDEQNEYLFLNSTPKFEERFGNLIQMSALETLKKFGVNNIERVFEKSVIKLK